MHASSLLSTLVAGLLAATPAFAGDVLLNQATADEFASIEGVDMALASRIVDLRGERGHLSSVEALRVLDVPATTLDTLRQEVGVELQVKKPGQAKTYASAGDVLAEFDHEPDVRAVQAMAMEYSKTSPELVEQWLSAAKGSYALPKVGLGYRKELDLYERHDYDLDANDELVGELDYTNAENDDTYAVTLRWDLNKLIMSSERIRVISETQDIVKLRDKVLDEVTRLYFDRRRLQVELLLEPPKTLQAQLEQQLRLQELTANLDAFTGGGFSRSLGR